MEREGGDGDTQGVEEPVGRPFGFDEASPATDAAASWGTGQSTPTPDTAATTPDAPVEQGGAPNAAAGSSRSGVGRRVGIIAPTGVAAVLAFSWFIIGGLPFADHDEHGAVAIQGPGDKAQPREVSLEEGDYYLYFEERGLSDADTVSAPDGLKVTVRDVDAGGRNGTPVEVEDVPGFLFSSQVNDVGWEPYGKFEANEGTYAVSATADPSGFGSVTIGNPPINPFGPPIVGSILIALVGVLLSVLISRSSVTLTRSA